MSLAIKGIEQGIPILNSLKKSDHLKEEMEKLFLFLDDSVMFWDIFVF